MDLLVDMGQMEARVSLFGYSIILDARLVHGLCQTCNRLRNKHKLVSVHLEIVNLGANRCMDWYERTIGSEIILGTHDGTPR
jgi:hypothetical protein